MHRGVRARACSSLPMGSLLVVRDSHPGLFLHLGKLNVIEFLYMYFTFSYNSLRER